MPAYKYKATGYVLALFIGGIGAHHFYYRNYGRGTIYLLFSWTFIPVILGWIDMVFIGKWNDEVNRRITEDTRLSNKREASKSSVMTSPILKKEDKPDNRNRLSDMPVIKSTKEDSSLISKEIIHPKYAHLLTPKHIEENVRNILKRPEERNHNVFVITYTTSQGDFARDSFKYRNKKQSKVPEIPLKEYWTTFSKLNDRQLKWYFYWREQALKGNYLNVDLSYLILFTYELINYTFESNAAFNISMLVRLHDNYVERIPQVSNYLPEWIADMLLELDEQDLAGEWRFESEKLPTLYSQLIEKRECLEKITIPTWRPYLRNIRETAFFSNNKNKVYKTFKESVPLLRDYHEAQENKLENVWFEKVVRRNVRPLYRSAVMARDVDDVHVYTTEYVPTELLYKEISTLFKLAENVTRSMNGEKREFKVEEGILPEDFRQRIIEEMAKAKCTNKRFRVVQEVSTISSGSTIPQPKVINEPDIENSVQAIQFDDLVIEEKITENRALQNEFLAFFERNSSIEHKEIASDHSNKQEAVNIENVVVNSKVDITEASEGNMNFFVDKDLGEENLGEFVSSLNNIEIKLLALLENRQLSIRDAHSFLKQQGQLPGMVLSTINEKANEFLGDILLNEMNGYIHVFEDFRQVTLLAKERVNVEN